MNVTCIICSDFIIAAADIYTTQCGHIFHYQCLAQWIERSKTCPQCRNKSTEKTIHRIYFNVANTDHILDDAATLQNKLDNLNFQMSLKDKDVKNLTDKYRKVKSQNIGLREELAALENKERVHDSVVHALKDQISYFKSKSKERDHLADEINRLKLKLKEVESVQLVISGSREEVNDMLRSENDKETLIILAATLKKALLDAEKKKLHIEHKCKQLFGDLSKGRREITSLESNNAELRKEIESSKASWNREKESLTNMILNMQHNACNEAIPQIKRIILESPVPATQKYLAPSSKGNPIDSPSVEEKVNCILESTSPYLQVKSNSVNIVRPSQQNYKSISAPLNTTKISIFNKPIKKLDVGGVLKTVDMVYDGLGGQAREDLYPSPRLVSNGVKRSRSSSLISSTKIRKLTPALSRKS